MKSTTRSLALLLPLVLLLGGCFLKPKTPEGEAFDRIYQNARQNEAVDIELLGHLQNHFDDKQGLAAASAEARKRLDRIEASTRSLKVEGELALLQRAQLQLLGAERALYKGVEWKKPDEITEGYQKGGPLAQTFIGLLQAYRAAHRQGKPEVVQSLMAYDREILLIKGKEDAQAYQKMVILVRDGKLAEARRIVEALRKKYGRSDFGTCLDLRYSDILMKIQPADEAGALELLEGILRGDGYNPDLAEAFWKWRALTQIVRHGTRNSSEIPNWEYNEVRWQLLGRIRQYQKLFPQEDWAGEQAWALMDLPNLNRGGAQGNYALVEKVILYEKPGYFYESIR